LFILQMFPTTVGNSWELEDLAVYIYCSWLIRPIYFYYEVDHFCFMSPVMSSSSLHRKSHIASEGILRLRGVGVGAQPSDGQVGEAKGTEAGVLISHGERARQ
jgi:hypothetical protein